jgi:DEAD/DEAH box helicase domain-containing protein
MVDPRDLGLVTQVRSPHHGSPTIYLYEAVPGGVGLSERLYARHDELVVGARGLIEACACESGCPACTGPRLDPAVDGKALALRLLAALGAPAVGVPHAAVPASASGAPDEAPELIPAAG